MEDFFERKKRQLNIQLNDVQKQAVQTTEGPLLLLACPGSGKTTTIIMRIGYLIEELGVQPRRIKAITFSKASASDMQKRFAALFPDLPTADFSTIHSLAFTISRKWLAKQGRQFTLLEGYPKQNALKSACRHVLKENATEDQLNALSTYVSLMKNQMIPAEKWTEKDEPFEQAAKIARHYESVKNASADSVLLDFDDLLLAAEQAMRTDEDLGAEFQSKYDYILTDESQDTSLVQHKIVEHLTAMHGNLCVVADDDQSIYAWRGADPDYLMDFKLVYPEAKLLYMEQNYRSSSEIVTTSASFIKRNTKRWEKKMHTENGSKGAIQLRRLHTPKQQLEYVTYELLAEEDLSEVAILFRNNASSTPFVNELHRRGIPFYMKDADDKFFSHWVVQDILNFMRLSFNLERKDIFVKVAGKMQLFVSNSTLQQFGRSTIEGNVFEAFQKMAVLKDSQVRKLDAYLDVYNKIPEMRPAQIIRMIRYELGYEDSLVSMSSKFGYRADSLTGILETLEGIAEQTRTMIEFAEQLKSLEDAVQEAKQEPVGQAVTLSTFHSAKGLEFKRVFMIDLVKGIIPSEEDLTEPSLLEEARRLFYVGMTRAKERLELLSYSSADGKSKEDSKFVNEVRGILLPKRTDSTKQKSSLVKTAPKSVAVNPNGIGNPDHLTKGTLVKHRVFGKGEIVDVSTETIEIRFAAATKRLALQPVLEKRMLEKADL
ncbi:ATP-dependent helicase [Sporosarcina gallistercoris]|uniref:DNA 3'-5' helicase n=1 Tax=Sporosarcina gallistercoris TaxID=2762245 RepID=A0ABR8PHX4_9BACL|nr:ATP-dependent helicase [Sporosarcina gallistercoris]MBD7907771.1 ATP-dependent helicase [Sporosarcina gallistercoris]